MKDFIKMTLAVIAGTLILSIFSCIVVAGLVGTLSTGTKAAKPIPAEGVLKIDLSKIQITEQTKEADPFSALQSYKAGFEMPQSIGLWDAVQAINIAAEDPAVKYIYLNTDANSTSLAPLGELRKSLQNFRNKSGKAVVTYFENPGIASYYLASVSDKIYMTSCQGGTPQMIGIGGTLMFFKDLLDKLGINVQLIRHGKYKSAGEPFIRNSSSPENRAQYTEMIQSVWNNLAEEITASRGISRKDLDKAIDELELCLPTDFLDKGFVDELLSREGLENKLADLAQKDCYSDISFIAFADYATAKVIPSKAKQKIAVIYADGEIVDGVDKTQVSGDHFASEIEKIRRDSTIKVVVLRVNSPGGSVVASEKIKDQLDLLKKDKPIIASYGDYAASGGYWISNNCDKIFTDGVTLTGSIGVFGMIPEFGSAVKNKLHVGVEAVTSHKHSDMFTLMRPFDKTEYAFMQKSIESIYDSFITIVSEGRGIAKNDVDAIAQGRVWTGSDALKIKLVDEIGTLEDAIHYAAATAGDENVKNWQVVAYPKPLSQIEMLMESIEGNDEDYKVLIKEYKNFKKAKVMARLPYNIKLQ